MACAARELQHDSAASIRLPVILDRGTEARIGLVGFAARPRCGQRFLHEGLLWEVVREADHERGTVARVVRGS